MHLVTFTVYLLTYSARHRAPAFGHVAFVESLCPKKDLVAVTKPHVEKGEAFPSDGSYF